MKRNGHAYDALIIGGGLGGLTCALALINKGKRVRLLEKIHMVGGYQGYFSRKGFLFEPCLHSVAEASPTGAVTKVLSSLKLKEIPQFIKLDPATCLIFPDKTYTVPADLASYQALLTQGFPQQAAGIEDAFKIMNEIYRALEKFPEKSPILERYQGKVFQYILDECVSDKKLQAVIAGFWGYLGTPPHHVSALVLSALNASLFSEGNYLPRDGINHLVKLLEGTIRERGGEISLNSSVKKIVIKDSMACGVVLESGETIDGNAVVSNVDATTTFFQMVGEEYLPADFSSQVKKLKPSLSALCVFLGVKNGGAIPDGLAATNLIYPDYDSHSQYERILQGTIERVPYCLVIPTLVVPSLAPQGHHVINLCTHIPYRPEGITNWKEKKEEYTERLITMAEKLIPGLRKQIVVKEAATPDTLLRYTSNREGALGGWAYTPETDAGRPFNKTPIERFWLTGHWTFPGVGIHGVITSGYLTASMIS